MASIDKRVTKLEDAVVAHLTESGEIRKSIEILAKSVQKISDRMWGAMVIGITTLLAMVGYLLKVSLWR